jgi:hypothetical protein
VLIGVAQGSSLHLLKAAAKGQRPVDPVRMQALYRG